VYLLNVGCAKKDNVPDVGLQVTLQWAYTLEINNHRTIRFAPSMVLSQRALPRLTVGMGVKCEDLTKSLS
jgi:hypothetical protein